VAAAGSSQATADLDATFAPGTAACHAFALRLTLPPGRWALWSIEVSCDVQMAPLALPSLRCGTNTIEYTDDSGAAAGRRTELTHRWLQRDAVPPPAPPELQQPVGDTFGLRPRFTWAPVGGAADYHFRLCPDAAMAAALSPVFDKLLSKTATAATPPPADWTPPHDGLLNPDTPYWWAVRARSAAGLWGGWSPAAAFVASGPALPCGLAVDADWDARTVVLRWAPGAGGSAVARWEVYASDERGFTAAAEPHTVVVGAGAVILDGVRVGAEEGTATLPANLLATVDEPSRSCELLVVGATLSQPAANRCYYRVVAVDAHGGRSGPSDYAEAPRPFLFAAPSSLAAVAGVAVECQLRALRSAGDLSCESGAGGKGRYAAAFRGADELRFLLDEAPSFVGLDRASGLLRLEPCLEHVGTHTCTVRVQDGRGGTDALGFDVTVLPPGAVPQGQAAGAMAEEAAEVEAAAL
jgi:hypothetical protein